MHKKHNYLLVADRYMNDRHMLHLWQDMQTTKQKPRIIFDFNNM